jgi:excisionase family DNA binding protein
MPSETPRYAPVKQAAADSGISYRTLMYWIKQGRIQAYRFGPRLLQVDLNELDALRVPAEFGSARRAS